MRTVGSSPFRSSSSRNLDADRPDREAPFAHADARHDDSDAGAVSRDPSWWASGGDVGASRGGAAGQGAERVAWQPGQSVHRSDIDSLYHHVELVSAASGVDTIDLIVLLLNNGLAYRGLTAPPSTLAMPPGDRFDWPADTPWTQWRPGEEGRPEVLQGIGSESWEAVEGQRIEPGSSSPDVVGIAGTYDRPRAINAGGTVVTSNDRVTLGTDGRFSLSSSSLATGNPAAPTGSASVTLQRSETAAGTTSTATVNGGEGIGLALNASRELSGADGASRRGSYRMMGDGFGVELKRDDGTIDQRLSFAYDDRLFIGDRSFGRVEPGGALPSEPFPGSAIPSLRGHLSAQAHVAGSGDSESSADERRRKRVDEAAVRSESGRATD